MNFWLLLRPIVTWMYVMLYIQAHYQLAWIHRRHFDQSLNVIGYSLSLSLHRPVFIPGFLFFSVHSIADVNERSQNNLFKLLKWWPRKLQWNNNETHYKETMILLCLCLTFSADYSFSLGYLIAQASTESTDNFPNKRQKKNTEENWNIENTSSENDNSLAKQRLVYILAISLKFI